MPIIQKIPQSIAIVLGLGILSLVSSAAAQDIKNYTSVTSQRLLNPEPENWLMYRGTYNGWGVDAQRKQELLDKAFGYKTHVPQGGVLWVFALAEE